MRPDELANSLTRRLEREVAYLTGRLVHEKAKVERLETVAKFADKYVHAVASGNIADGLGLLEALAELENK